MKYSSFSLIAILVLSGCQLTQDQTTDTNETNQDEFISQEDIASPIDVNEALTADGTIDVYHPVDDVEIKLAENDMYVTDDLWQRIRNKITFEIPQNKRLVIQRNWFSKNQAYLDRCLLYTSPSPRDS